MTLDPTLLLVFCRTPGKGPVKTRLASELGAEAAAKLYEACLEDTIRVTSSKAASRLQIWHTPAADGEALTAWIEERGLGPVELRAQPQGDLGERMAAALDEALGEAHRVVLIGSDAPGLPARFLQLAYTALAEVDLVFGPALDGGFYAVGARRAASNHLAPLFSDIRWSKSDTLFQVITHALRERLSVALLPPWSDLDVASDLEVIGALLRVHHAAGEELAPRFFAAARRWLADGGEKWQAWSQV